MTTDSSSPISSLSTEDRSAFPLAGPGAPPAPDVELRTRVRHLEVLYRLSTNAVGAQDLEAVYQAAIEAVLDGLGADRASLLLFEPDGVLRFKAYRGLSKAYRTAVEGHTPWQPTSTDVRPILVPDVDDDEPLKPYRAVIRKEGIRSLAFIPLRHEGRVLGKFMAYFNTPHVYTVDEIRLSEMIANHVAVIIAQRAAEDARELAARRELAERRKVEAALRDSEERYRMLSEATTDYIFSYARGANGYFGLEWISEAFERITGRSSDDIFEQDRWTKTVHPEDASIVAAFQDKMRRGERHVMEHRLICKDGSVAWVRVYGRPIVDETTHEVYRVLGAGQDITARKTAERALHELAESLERRVDERTRALATANERLRSEVQERAFAEEQLARANDALRTSNRELQDFAYVASHDLQEPLRKIQSFADLLRSDYGPRLDDQGRFYIQRMQSAASRMSDLIKGLLGYSRIRTQGAPFEMVDLNEVVRDVLSDLEITIAETRGAVNVQTLPTIEADPTQMGQLFQNLIGNALKFRDTERPPLVRINGREADGQCTLEISDNGIGFATQYADRIFSPFQRLHGRSAYSGTGMGLAICRRIVERHGGMIDATGRPQEGATFTVALPLRQERWNGKLTNMLARS